MMKMAADNPPPRSAKFRAKSRAKSKASVTGVLNDDIW